MGNFFHAKTLPLDGHDGRRFRPRGDGKALFSVTSNVQIFLSESRELIKELVYQKKNGGYRASKRVISMKRIKASTRFLCRNIIYRIIRSICLCFSLFSVLRLKQIMHFSMLAILCCTKTAQI